MINSNADATVSNNNKKLLPLRLNFDPQIMWILFIDALQRDIDGEQEQNIDSMNLKRSNCLKDLDVY